MNKIKQIIPLLLLLLLVQLSVVAGAQERVTYIHTDALGSPIAASDEDGNLIWRESYQPYGKRLRLQKGSDRPWYTGKYEEDMGLLYYGKRWYNPEIGRFYSVDPARFDESNIHSFNRYAYANNNPYKFVDPDGASAVTAFGGLLYETGQLLTGNGFDSGRVWGALRDGYNGEGEGFAQAAFDDATTFIPLGVVAGTVAKLGKLVKAAKATKSANKEITKSSRKRVKRLIKKLSDNSRQNNGLSQEKTDQLRRIVERAGGKLRNDGISGVKGSSAGKPHVQTEGFGKSIDSRHIWTRGGV